MTLKNSKKKLEKKSEILYQHFGEQIVGGRLSELANYSDLFEKLNDSILLLDIKNFNILECNPAAIHYLGYAEENILGQSIFSFIPEENQFLLRQYFERAKKEDSSISPFDIKIQNKDKNEKINEVILCRLKLEDYCEVFQWIGKDVDQARAYEAHLKNLTVIDSMTQVPNFRAFQKELSEEHERASRYGSPYSLLFCDVDHFKQYNDQNGHPAGDEVLKKIAKNLNENIRKSDFLARYGGEEFVVLCKGSTLESGKKLAEKLRKLIETTLFEYSKNQPLGFVSLSIGVAEFPKHGSTSAEVVEAADKAVYLSKKNGRNKVSCAN